MRPLTAGRIGIVFAVLLAIAVPAGLLIHGAAGAYLDSQAARSALTAALAALPVAVPETPTIIKGEPAGEQQRAQLMKPAEAYIRLLRKSDYSGAWELMAPDHTGAWTQESWTDHMLRVGAQEPPSEAILMLLLSGLEREVVEVVTRGDRGLAHVALRVQWPVNLVLRRSRDDWAIDLAQSDRAAALSDAAGQLEKARGDSAMEMLIGMQIFYEGGSAATALLAQGAFELEDEQVRLSSATVDGDIAQVAITCSGLLHLALPLQTVAGRWQLDLSADAQIMTPGAELRELMQATEGGDEAEELCQEHMRQLARAMLVYRADYDEVLPIADRWCDGIEPYVGDGGVFHCPADDGEYSYAMNYKLSRLSADKITAPDSTILLFESEPSRKNGWDEGGAFPGSSLADPPRHTGTNNFAWSDGHVTAMFTFGLEPDMYRPTGRESVPGGGGPEWITDYAEGLKTAGQQGKPVMIDLYADWCGPCNMLDEQTWSDAEVQKLAAEFVCMKIDTDKDDKTAALYEVEAIPLVVFLDPSGKETGRQVGFVGPEEMLLLMKRALGK